MLIRRSDGQKSTSVTFAWISFIFCLICISLGLVEHLEYDGVLIHIRMIDASIVFCLLAPSFGLYGFRRYLNPLEQGQSDRLSKASDRDSDSQRTP